MSFHKSLTQRYLVALGMIVTILLVTCFVRIYQTQSYDQFAHIINISGMQRMLSQRIAFFAREISLAEEPSAAQDLFQKMESDSRKMRSNFVELTAGITLPLSPAIKDIYYGPQKLAQETLEFLQHVDVFLEIYRTKGVSGIRDDVEKVELITQLAKSGLLKKLNGAVFQYQYESEKGAEDIRLLEIFLLLFGIGVVVFEVVYIFRPMVAKVVEKNRQLKAANDELLKFSYRISHDLKGPVLSSLGVLTVIEDMEPKKEVQAPLAMINKEMQRLSKLVSDMTNLIKMKQEDILLQSMSVNETIEAAWGSLSHLPRFQEVQFVNSGHLDKIVSQQNLVLQIFANLFSNSINFSDPAASPSLVEVSSECIGDFWVFTVSDNGIGFDPRFEGELFQMFKRFHPNLSLGSGLGLYLVRQNALALGGTIAYLSDGDKTRFVLKLPVREV